MGAPLAQFRGVAVNLRDRARAVNRLIHRNKEVDVLRDMRLGGQPAADIEMVAVLAGHGMLRADHRKVVDLRQRAVHRTRDHGNLIFARQIAVLLGMLQKELVERLDGRADVEQLVVRQPRHRAAGDIPRDIAARSRRRDSDRVQAPQDIRHLLDLEPVELEGLARRDIGHAMRRNRGRYRPGCASARCSSCRRAL